MHHSSSTGATASLPVRPIHWMRARLACVAFAVLASAPAAAASQPTGEAESRWSTSIGSLTIGSGDETATFTDVRSTCNAFRLALAFGTAAADVRRCLPGQEQRRAFLEIENGRVTSSSVDPDDDAGRCVTQALGGAQLGGLTCALEASVQSSATPARARSPGRPQGLTIGSLEATHGNGSEYRFPLIAGESRAASRINTFLQSIELHKLPGRYDKSAFEDVWPDEGSSNGLTSLDYSHAFNQPGILSVDISGLYYGAYESASDVTYHFDARSGEVITLRSLFTPEGLARLDEEITRARLQRVDDFMAGKQLAHGVQLRSDPAVAGDQRELYRECRSWIEKGHPVVDDRLTLEQHTLSLQREPCAPHALRAIDDLDFPDTRSFARVGMLLNDYGRCLLIARREDCQRSYSGISAGVYRGMIGDRYPITLVVEKIDTDGDLQASYFYDKYARAIALNGAEAADGGIQLNERGSPPARFALRTQSDGRLTGEWTQEGKAPRKVELQ